MKAEIIYNPLSDSVIVEFGDWGVAELERVDVGDDIEAWVRSDASDQFASVSFSRLAELLEDRRQQLVQVVGYTLAREIEQLRRDNVMVQRPSLDQVQSVKELRGALDQGRSVHRTVTLPEALPGQHLAALVGAGLGDIPPFALIVRSIRDGIQAVSHKAAKMQGKTVELVQRVIPLEPVPVPAAGRAGRLGGEIRERYLWKYGSENPVELTIRNENDEFFSVRLESQEYRSRVVTLHCWLKPSVAEMLRLQGEYHPQEHKLTITTEIDRDGSRTVPFAWPKRRDQPLQQAELLDHFQLEVEAPPELGRIRVGSTTILVLAADILTEPVDAIINPIDPIHERESELTKRIIAGTGESIQNAIDHWVADSGPPGTGAILVTDAQPPIRRIIHIVPPVYGKDSIANQQQLQQAVTAALDSAAETGAKTIGIPPISTGGYGYPLEEASKIITRTTVEYVRQYPDRFTEIRLIGPARPDHYDPDAQEPAFEFAKALTDVED